MPGLKTLLLTLLITILITFTGGFAVAKSAEATTQRFQWTGKTGYYAQGTFSYDEEQASTTISEQGAGKTTTLNSLIVTFYNPSGEAINTYKNVVNGVAEGNYFEFHFDRVNQKLFGSLDLGGELAGEMYLKGKVARELALIKVEQSGIDSTLDQDTGTFTSNE